MSNGELRDEVVDMSALALQVADELARLAPQRQVEIVVAEGITARGDGSLLRAVVENLLGNAFKFTMRAARPRIELGCTRTARVAVFFVRDNGAGFDMKYASKTTCANRQTLAMTTSAWKKDLVIAEYVGNRVG